MSKNTIVTILAVIGALVVLGWVLKLTFKLHGPLLLLGVGYVVYRLLQDNKRIGGAAVMAEDKGGDVVSFIAEQFKRVHARFDTLDGRFERLEERVAQVERRLTASTHLEQGLVAHMASLHESMGQFRATTVSFDKRLTALEAR